MKAEAHLQIVALYPNGDPSRQANGARIVNMTQGVPRVPEPGALVVKVSIDVDPDIFAVPTLNMVLDADATDIAAALVPVPVADEGDEA